MEEDFRKKIINELVESGAVDSRKKVTHETEEVHVDSTEVEDSDVGVSSDGTKYIKSLVNKYLSEKGYRFTQENIDLAAKMFVKTDNGYARENVKTVITSEVDNWTDEQITSYAKVRTLSCVENIKSEVENIKSEIENFQEMQAKTIELIRKEMFMQHFMDYDVDIIGDKLNGGTRETFLKISLDVHSAKGWKLKDIFTNEKGTNKLGLSVGKIAPGSDTTVDQIVLIYERPMVLRDNDAERMIKDIKDGKVK